MISVIIPVREEEGNVKELCKQLNYNLQDFKHEIIFVDDGSRDDTVLVLKTIKGIKLVVLRKNFGKSAAIMEGLAHSSAKKDDIILMMDGDLEDRPDQIGQLYLKLREEYDCVVGWRKYRKHSLSKRLFSKIFNTLTCLFTGTELHDANCGFKMMTKQAADSLHLYGELHRYIPAILYNNGFKVGEQVVKHGERKYGETKYNMFRIFVGFIDLLTVVFLNKYSKRPAQFFAMIGFSFFGLSALSLLFVLYRIFNHGPTVTGLIFTSLFTIAGLIFMVFGLIGELIITKKNGDTFQVREVFG